MTGRFKKDSNIFGALLGVMTIVITFIVVFAVNYIFKFEDEILQKKLFLLCIIPNVFLIRYYFKVLFFEKTGKSILFISFAFLVAFTIYFFKR